MERHEFCIIESKHLDISVGWLPEFPFMLDSWLSWDDARFGICLLGFWLQADVSWGRD